jgi:Effector-associated domain 1
MADQPCVDLDDVVKNLATGTYRFNKPEAAYVEEPFRVVLALPTAPGQDVSRPFSGAPGKIEERTAPIARYLQATLRGGLDFKVIPPGPQPRTVTTSAPVVWEWEVVPLRHGKKSLVIDVSANLLVGPQKELVQLQTLSEEIQINVGIVRWITSTFFGLPGIAFGLAAMLVVGLGALNYLRPGSVPGAARVAELLAGEKMPPGARSRLRAAILAGFDHESLDQVLRDTDMLRPEVETGSFAKRVDSLIEVARQQGWLIELCDALASARSGNAPVNSAILAVRQSLTDQATRATRPAVTSG